jgi:3-hydroxyacyl-[acyl-carrier-protein] dehydratase
VRFTDEIRPDLSGRSARASLFVDPHADYLDDHFPGDPMLPGLVMLEAAVRAASVVWSENGQCDGGPFVLDRVERLQVTRRVLPGDTLVVTAEIADATEDRTPPLFTAIGVVAGQTAMRATFRLRPLDATADPSGRRS